MMPNNAGLADQVVKLEKANEGMQARLESYNAAAREIEDQIFKINQPKQQQYQITPVK